MCFLVIHRKKSSYLCDRLPRRIPHRLIRPCILGEFREGRPGADIAESSQNGDGLHVGGDGCAAFEQGQQRRHDLRPADLFQRAANQPADVRIGIAEDDGRAFPARCD